MCLFCFSSAPLSDAELQGTKYGNAYGKFASFGQHNTFDVTLCQTPCRAPGCWLISMACLCPAQIYLRHRALNHVEPGSGWSNYMCCQGYFGGCCCLQPGNVGDKQCPICCMTLEAFLCTGPAASATSSVIREEYQLGMDEDDVRLIRCTNCLQFFSICVSCIAPCTECEGDDLFAGILNTVADVVFCCVAGCMTAQTHHEIKLREQMAAPQRMRMDRF